jgi:hypothetical protein
MRLFSRMRSTRKGRWWFRGLVALLIVVVVFVALVAAIAISPGFGAWGAEAMRAVFGERATAAFEGFVLSVQDLFRRFTYALGIGREKDPFASATDDSAATTLPVSTTTTTVPPTTTSEGGSDGTVSTTTESTTTSTTEARWRPPDLEAMGTLDNEGAWAKYLVDSSGRAVGFRTALQPDPKRGFAVAAIVAMDLKYSRLRFLLGSEEPKSETKLERTGTIPKTDFQPGRLLAVFNGGFQAEHGAFGAMADGAVALPPRPDFATIVLYKDGRVAIGAWGSDIIPSDDMESWRQNGPLIISGGRLRPEVENSDPRVWGFVYGGGVAAWRSAVGLSKDGRTLYFVAGPSLTIESLAAAMLRAGIWQGFQLDINHAWTIFDKIVVKKGKLGVQALMDGMHDDERMIQGYKRDFFYLTGS